MIDEKSIKKEISELDTLYTVTRAYEEIASVRMRKTRSSVLRSREFLDKINTIFDEVRFSYAEEILSLLSGTNQKGKDKITFLAHNGKVVSVFLSANVGLYGDIVPNTFEMFMKEVKSQQSEVTIIGKLGLSLFQSEMPNSPYTYFELPDSGVDETKMAEIIKHIVQYEEIHIYYGKFQSVVTQTPTEMVISSRVGIAQKKAGNKIKYIFEPSLEKILMFFETEIFASLFEQSVRESQLAKFASRLLAMDKAGENIKQGLKNLNSERLRVNHITLNRKQLNSLVSVASMTAPGT